MNQSRLTAALSDDGADAVFFAKVGLWDELDVDAMFTRDGLGTAAQLQPEPVRPVRVIENADALMTDEPCHSGGVSDIDQCPRKNNAVITAKGEGDLIGMMFGEVTHALTIQHRSANIERLN